MLNNNSVSFHYHNSYVAEDNEFDMMNRTSDMCFKKFIAEDNNLLDLLHIADEINFQFTKQISGCHGDLLAMFMHHDQIHVRMNSPISNVS